MGIWIERRKKRNRLLSVLYRIHKILPFSDRRKLLLYLDLEWIFERLALEMSFKHYALTDHPIRQFAMGFILKQVEPQSNVLDLGCKVGDMSFALAKQAAFVVGIDHDAKAIEEAQRNYQRDNLEFQCADALTYMMENDRKFDILILSHLLEHLDDPEEFIRMFKGFFRKIYIELPDFDKSYLNQYRKDLGVDLIYTDNDHVSEFDRHELVALLERCGVEVLDREYRFGMQRLWCVVRINDDPPGIV